jgi:hypothetical protein
MVLANEFRSYAHSVNGYVGYQGYSQGLSNKLWLFHPVPRAQAQHGEKAKHLGKDKHAISLLQTSSQHRISFLCCTNMHPVKCRAHISDTNYGKE